VGSQEGQPRARHGTGRPSGVCPRWDKCTTAFFGQDGGPYITRHFSCVQGVHGRGGPENLEDGWRQWGTIKDGRARWVPTVEVGDCWRLQA